MGLHTIDIEISCFVFMTPNKTNCMAKHSFFCWATNFPVNFSRFAKLGCAHGFMSHLNQSYQTKRILKATINVVWVSVNVQ